MVVSDNGYLVDPNPVTLGIQTFVVNGVAFGGGVKGGAVHTVLHHVAAQVAARVEAPDTSLGCYGYAYRMNVNNSNAWSNHASGTAIDFNASSHGNGSTASSSWSFAQIAEIHKILAEVKNAVRWGGDYSSTPDSMHFEINVSPATLATVAATLPATGGGGSGGDTGPATELGPYSDADFDFDDTPLARGDWYEFAPYPQYFGFNLGFGSDPDHVNPSGLQDAMENIAVDFAQEPYTIWAIPPEQTPNAPEISPYTVNYTGPDAGTDDFNTGFTASAAGAHGATSGPGLIYSSNASFYVLGHCWNSGTQGAFTFPFGDGYPNQHAISTQIGRQFRYFRPGRIFQLPPDDLQGDDPLAFTLEYESGVATAKGALVEYNIPVRVGGFSNDQFQVSASVELRMALNATDADFVLDSGATPPDALGMALSSTTNTQTATVVDGRWVVDGVVWMTGSITLNEAQMAAYSRGLLTFEYRCNNIVVTALGDWHSIPGQWTHHQDWDIWVAVNNDKNVPSPVSPDYRMRITYTMQTPDARTIGAKPFTGDGGPPPSAPSSGEPVAIIGILGNDWNDSDHVNRYFKWTAGGGLEYFHPWAEWGRNPGGLTLIDGGRLFALDTGSNNETPGQRTPLGYVFNPDFTGFESVGVTYPYERGMSDDTTQFSGVIVGNHCVWRSETKQLWYTGIVTHKVEHFIVLPHFFQPASYIPPYLGQDGEQAFQYAWNAFDLATGQDVVHTLDEGRMGAEPDKFGSTVTYNGWWYQASESYVQRFSPATGDAEFIYFDLSNIDNYARMHLLGIDGSTLLMYNDDDKLARFDLAQDIVWQPQKYDWVDYPDGLNETFVTLEDWPVDFPYNQSYRDTFAAAGKLYFGYYVTIGADDISGIATWDLATGAKASLFTFPPPAPEIGFEAPYSLVAITASEAAGLVAEFTISVDESGWVFSFDGSLSTTSSGTIVGYAWDFTSDPVTYDPPQETEGVLVEHTFEAVPATYLVTLVVTGSDGQTASVSHPVIAGGGLIAENPLDDNRYFL